MPALGRVGVAAHRVHLADDGDVRPVGLGGQGGPHPSEAGPDYQYVVVEQVSFHLPTESLPNRPPSEA